MSDINKYVFIYGAGDLGREIYNSILECNKISKESLIPLAFIDDNEMQDGCSLDGLVIKSFKNIKKEEFSEVPFIIAIGNGLVRSKIKEKIELFGGKLSESIIHPKAHICTNVIIDKGCFIGPNTTVSIGCHIKDNVIINQNVSLGHDCILESNVVISPGCILSGRTKVRDSSFLGSGTVTLPSISIGVNCIIGANVTVSQNIEDSVKLLAVVRNMSLPMEQV